MLHEKLRPTGLNHETVIPDLPPERRGARRLSFRARILSVGLLSAMIFSIVGSCLAQSSSTTINLATQSRNADFSAFPVTRPVSVGASLPATCVIGQLFFNQLAPAGSNLYACTAANTWTVIGGGTGGAQPQVSFSAPGIAFGSQDIGTTSGVQSVTLTNLGMSLLSITSAQTTGPNASDFAAANTCGSLVASGASCTISVSFTPSTSGAETASLVFNDNQPGPAQALALTGTGAAPVSSGGLVITPSAAVANVGQSITLTSNRPVNWGLVSGSAGTLVNNSSTSATYTAPVSIPTQNALAGCPVLPNDAIFNVRIDSLPLNANSAAWSANAAPNIGLFFDTSWGTSIGDNTMPLTDETFYYTSTANGPWLIPPVPYLKRENGDYVGRGNNEDHHVLAVNRSTCQFYETYNNFLTAAPCPNPAQTCTATSGWAYSSASYVLPANGSTDAASLPLAPLTLHLDEIKAGAVRHPLRFTLARGYIQAGNPLWPAFGTNGWGASNMPPYGARFRLKASYNISSFTPAAQTILTGLK